MCYITAGLRGVSAAPSSPRLARPVQHSSSAPLSCAVGRRPYCEPTGRPCLRVASLLIRRLQVCQHIQMLLAGDQHKPEAFCADCYLQCLYHCPPPHTLCIPTVGAGGEAPSGAFRRFCCSQHLLDLPLGYSSYIYILFSRPLPCVHPPSAVQPLHQASAACPSALALLLSVLPSHSGQSSGPTAAW